MDFEQAKIKILRSRHPWSLNGTAQLTMYYSTQLRFCLENWLINPAWLIGSTAVSEKHVSDYKLFFLAQLQRRLLIEVPEVLKMEPKTNAPERKTSCFWKPSCSTSTFCNLGHALRTSIPTPNWIDCPLSLHIFADRSVLDLQGLQ